jgi:hypothetical protein
VSSKLIGNEGAVFILVQVGGRDNQAGANLAQTVQMPGEASGEIRLQSTQIFRLHGIIGEIE